MRRLRGRGQSEGCHKGEGGKLECHITPYVTLLNKTKQKQKNKHTPKKIKLKKICTFLHKPIVGKNYWLR